MGFDPGGWAGAATDLAAHDDGAEVRRAEGAAAALRKGERALHRNRLERRYAESLRWFLSLEANPECELQVASKHLYARARIAEGEERERFWQQMVAMYLPYTEYQQNAAPRRIPAPAS